MTKAKHKAPKSDSSSQPKGLDAPVRAKPFPIVGIGASAGGLEAVTQLLKSLPRTGMALVLVQHLDPTHESALTAILTRSTSMPVVEARNNMRIEPDHLYVIPPNKLIVISHRQLKLSPLRHQAVHMAVDHFFCTLAEQEGDCAFGVILSGNGTDGTQGLRAIKAAGGVTFAQEEKTAKYPSMPGSAITSGCVDFVLSPERIARELARIAGHPYVAPPIVPTSAEEARAPEDEPFEEILTLLRQRTGVDFLNYKHATLRRRIQRRMMLHKFETSKEYLGYLQKHTGEVNELYSDILIHVTGFFRDPSVYQLLKRKIFPRLRKSKSADEPFRIWVPGCSTGEEVYSIAIVLSEFVGEQRLHNPVQIFGTDINDNALEKARAGRYLETIANDLSQDRLRRFFLKAEQGYRINKSIRDLCIFARQNVFVDPPFSNLDLISCRNVLIYLGPPLQRRVLPLFHYGLRPNGCLLLGASETIGSFVELFSLIDKRAKVYVKKTAPNRPPVTFGRAAPVEPQALPGADQPAPVTTPIAAGLAEVQRQADRILLSHFSPAGVIINEHLEVLQFRGHTGQFLEHAHGDASLDLLKMAREGLIVDLRTVITRAMRQGTRARRERVLVKQNGHTLEVNLEAIPFVVPPSSEQFYLVLFESNSPPRETVKPRPVSEKNDKFAEDAKTVRLGEELAATRESMQAIIEEQEATNEELRSANEEITSSNEELQSTNEEVETAKEELQSTNEELTTLNDELVSRNGELEQVNNDLHNVLASVNIPIIIVSADLRIRRFTNAANRSLNLIPGDIGRPITDINLPLALPNLAQLVIEVMDSLASRELEARGTDDRLWSVRIRPYKTTDNKIDGALIALIDVDAVSSNLLPIGAGRSLMDIIIGNSREPTLWLDKKLVIRAMNRAFCDHFQLDLESLRDQPIFEAANGFWDIPKLRTLLEEKLPVSRSRSCADCTFEHKFPELGTRVLKVNATTIPTEGEPQGVLLALQDATATQPR